jgi:hypothetical protein
VTRDVVYQGISVALSAAFVGGAADDAGIGEKQREMNGSPRCAASHPHRLFACG